MDKNTENSERTGEEFEDWWRKFVQVYSQLDKEGQRLVRALAIGLLMVEQEELAQEREEACYG